MNSTRILVKQLANLYNNGAQNRLPKDSGSVTWHRSRWWCKTPNHGWECSFIKTAEHASTRWSGALKLCTGCPCIFFMRVLCSPCQPCLLAFWIVPNRRLTSVETSPRPDLDLILSRFRPDSDLKSPFSGPNQVEIRSKSGPNQVWREVFGSGRGRRGRSDWSGSVAPRKVSRLVDQCRQNKEHLVCYFLLAHYFSLLFFLWLYVSSVLWYSFRRFLTLFVDRGASLFFQ